MSTSSVYSQYPYISIQCLPNSTILYLQHVYNYQRPQTRRLCTSRVKKLRWFSDLVWRSSLQELQGPLICCLFPPLNASVLLALAVIRPVSISFLSSVWARENTVLSECRHLCTFSCSDFLCKWPRMIKASFSPSIWPYTASIFLLYLYTVQ